MSFDFEAKGKEVVYKEHSTQLNLYDCCSEKDFNFHFLQQRIPEDAIYREFPQVESPFLLGSMKTDNPKEKYGLESVAHISVLYGISDENDYFKLREKLKDFGKFEFKIGDVSSFRKEDKPYDVLILKIISPKLEELHKIIKDSCDNSYSFPEYIPHMTLAYVNKGMCKDLEGKSDWTGDTYSCGIIKFSHKDGYFLDIPLIEIIRYE